MSSRHLYDLSALGWDEFFAAEFDQYEHFCRPGRVVRVDRGAAHVLTTAGEVRVDQSAPLRRVADIDPLARPTVGDWAAVTGGELHALLPRRTALVRGGVARDSRAGLSGDSRGHVLAANIDVALVAEPVAPGLDLARIERFQALAWESGATPVVVLTKADLAADLPELVADVTASAPGSAVHAVSTRTGEGVAEVRPAAGCTAVLLGPSGAGKSSLLNAFAGTEVMATQQVRAADGRGRHTTTHRELIVLPDGGLIIDTPGIRRVGLYDTSTGLASAFADIEELAAACRFTDCAHAAEPGCAVRAAVDSGDLPVRRLDSWHKLAREAAWMAARGDARLRAEQTRHWKIIHKELRRSGRGRP